MYGIRQRALGTTDGTGAAANSAGDLYSAPVTLCSAWDVKVVTLTFVQFALFSSPFGGNWHGGLIAGCWMCSTTAIPTVAGI